MRITFQDRISGRVVNERSAFDVVALFWDDSTETWTADTPASVQYRLDDITGNQITGWTAVTPATSVTISLSATQNAISNDCRDFETKQLTVKADNYQEVYVYRVRNLAGQI